MIPGVGAATGAGVAPIGPGIGIAADTPAPVVGICIGGAGAAVGIGSATGATSRWKPPGSGPKVSNVSGVNAAGESS